MLGCSERNKKQPSVMDSWERDTPWLFLYVLGCTGFGSQACVEGTCTGRAGPPGWQVVGQVNKQWVNSLCQCSALNPGWGEDV